jgi:ClpP class serine protease
LDIDLVATDETWFGEDTLEMGLCDELNTVDDVLVDDVDVGHNVYQVCYDPNDVPVSPLSSLLPGTCTCTSNDVSATDANEAGFVQGAVRWLVRNINPTLKDEISKEFGVSSTANAASSTSQVQERYMFRDPSSASTNIKVQDQ